MTLRRAAAVALAVIGPSLAGVTFQWIAFSAPYFMGSLFSVCAFIIAYMALPASLVE